MELATRGSSRATLQEDELTASVVKELWYASKRMGQFVKFVRRFLIRKLNLCSKRRDTDCGTIRRMCHIFTAKGAAILGLRRVCCILFDA